MPNIISQGAGSAQGYGFTARSSAPSPVYVEDVFSTYLYTGNGGTQTITTDLDLSTKGGLVWIKNRTNASTGHALTDTARGAGTGTTNTATNILASNSANGTGGNLPSSGNDYLSAFTTTGFTVVASSGANAATRITNRASDEYASWSFEKQAKFFDIVTYTGNGANRTISHNLGSVPGCIMVKRTDTTGDWQVYHRSLANTEYIVLNSSAAKATGTARWNSTTPTASVFSLGTEATVNASGGTYVAYLFAHDAGGFGLSGSDNVISCGSYTGTGVSGNTITLGYEPQWILFKRTDLASTNWFMFDNMRSLAITQSSYLYSNQLVAEAVASPPGIATTPTGFYLPTTSSPYNASGGTFMYIAIRRGPMRTPTDATKVFSANAVTVAGAPVTVTTGFPVDMSWTAARGVSSDRYVNDRLRVGSLTSGRWFLSNSTGAEANQSFGQNFARNDGIVDDIWNGFALLSGNVVFWNFRRAPGFFDIASYTGTGATRTVSHNLGVTPELMIMKRRPAAATNWAVYAAGIGSFTLVLNNANGKQADFNAYFANTNPTSSVFTVGADADVNASGSTYIAYLFASLAGISKVGTYTGNGSSQTINCGFLAGSRFVMIKRADSTGNWTIFDSARGIVAGNDPALYANTNAAEVTTIDAIDSDSTGFIVNQDTTLNLNVSSASYVYLAIA